ncbi:MAG TPA: sulfatase-like hydrolase/transferase [Edaphobacter sp.]|nr:sulfatase-like hydrolase/transferase [Edaphobacter sp.]
MNRRTFLTQSAAALTTMGTGFLKAGPMPKRRPNVLLLMADQHKRSCMGAYGDPVARTPNLDRLAAGSTRFTQAYCTNPVCTPSRASIMTGLYSHHLEAQNNTTPYSPKHRTIAHHFNAAGYMTALIGKMHWVDAQSHGFEYRLEFNDWYQYLGPKIQLYADELGRPNSGSGLPEIDDLWRDHGDPWKGHRKLDDRKGSVAVGRVSLLPEEDHFDSFVARESVRFLRNFGQADQPFLLVSSFLKPHDPFMPAERFAKMFEPEQMTLPASWGKADKSKLPNEVRRSIDYNGPTPELADPAEAKKRIALYYANLAQMDDCLGKVVREISELGLENDTIICYTSDHGEMLGELGLWQKFQFYEGSCGIPLMIRVPGRSASVCEEPVSLVSLATTLTDLAGVPLLTTNDGTSLRSVMQPSKGHVAAPVFAEFALNTKGAKTMIRDGEWKYTLWENDIPELYNLRSDPMELRNLAALPEHQSRTEDLKQKILRWRQLPIMKN